MTLYLSLFDEIQSIRSPTLRLVPNHNITCPYCILLMYCSMNLIYFIILYDTPSYFVIII